MPNIKDETELYKYMLKNIKDLKRSMEFDVYDFISDEKKSIFEVKVRKVHYDDLIIEKKKYHSVIDFAEGLLYIPYYVCATPEGVYAFNLFEIEEPDWVTQAMPKTTDFSRRYKVDKDIGYLNICSSILI